MKLRIKPDFSASCIDHRTVQKGASLNGELANLRSRCYVAQTFLEHDIEFSIPFMLMPDGSRKVYDPCGQHIVHGPDGKDDFNGNYKLRKGKLTRRMYRDAMAAAQYHIDELIKLGYTEGWGSIDFVGNTKTQEVWAIERNARTTATLYPIRGSELLFEGKVMPFNNRGFIYQRGMDVEVLHGHFDGLLLRPGGHTGLVLYCVLPEVQFAEGEPTVGFSYAVSYARTYDELEQLDREVDDRMDVLSKAA